MPNTREKLIELLAQYFDIGDSYAYNLTRDKMAFMCGTMGFDDFEEFDEETVADIADHLIANGVTVQEWIPVSERLPREKGEICKNVILFMDDGLVTVGWLNEDIMSAFYLDTRNDFVSRVPMSRCTHWMPLPNPPKGE